MATKIMLVEDDTNLSSIYKARLEAEGFQIINASDGEEALALAVKERPDLIISDVMMPKISGFDMLDILRGTDGIKDTKVIMMTALGQAEDKTRADKLGANRYLVKSQVTLEDVVRTVHEVLEGQPAPAPQAAPAAAAEAPAPAAAPVAAASQPAATPVPAVAAPVEPPAQPAVTPTVTAIPVQAPPAGSGSVAPTNAAATPITPAPEPQAPAPEPTQTATAPTTGQTSNDEQAAVLSQIEDFLDKQEAPAPAALPPASKPAVVNPSAPAESATPDNSVSSKRVIQPIGGSEQPKTNLADLLDKEAASKDPTVPPSAANHSTDGFIAPNSPAQTQPQATALDPNKISL